MCKKMVVFFSLFISTAVFAYNTHGVKWPVNSVSYDASSMSSSQKNSIAYAVGKWENEADFDWRYNSSSVNDVYFYDIDGRGGTYAYVNHWTVGNYITKFRMRFDEGESWYSGSGSVSSSRLDLRSVAAHEFGHAVGVAHTQSSRCTSSVSELRRPTMCPTYAYGKSHWRTLEDDDERAVQSLYGNAFSAKSFMIEPEARTDSSETMTFEFAYEELSVDDLVRGSDRIVSGVIISISETKWNQDSNEYWEDESEDRSTLYTAIPFFEVEVDVHEVLSGETRSLKPVVITVLGLSPRDDEQEIFSAGEEGVFFLRVTDLAWRYDETRKIVALMSSPETSVLSKRRSGALFSEIEGFVTRLRDSE